MALEEPQLNGRIASVLRPMVESSGWTVREELLGALRGPKTKPDVLITRGDDPPIVLETEYPPNPTLESDCMKSIGRELNPSVAGASGRVSTVIALRATDELHQCANGDEAQQMLEAGHEIEYAVYQGNGKEQTRFPQSGFIQGNIRDLVDFIRPAAIPQDVIDKATQAFEDGVEDAAMWIMDGLGTLTSASPLPRPFVNNGQPTRKSLRPLPQKENRKKTTKTPAHRPPR